MKNLYFILIFAFIAKVSLAQNDSKLWIEVDGGYWQKGNPSTSFNTYERERSGSIRPMIGLNFSEKWGVGVMMNFQSYRVKTDDVQTSYPIYDYDDQGNYTNVQYEIFYNKAAIQNDLKGFGLFIRRNIKLGNKTSLNFNFYGLKESGKEGNIEVYPGPYYPCFNCLSISNYAYENPIIETNWKFGIDVAFAYQATKWMALEIRANLFEFRRQIIKDNAPQLIDPGFSPSYTFYNIYNKFGTKEDFGSAVNRDGIRFGLLFNPF